MTSVLNKTKREFLSKGLRKAPATVFLRSGDVYTLSWIAGCPLEINPHGVEGVVLSNDIPVSITFTWEDVTAISCKDGHKATYT